MTSKKRVAILYSGQIRNNSLNPSYTNVSTILDATSKFLLNDTFKNKYEYDVFISTDQINIDKTISYFGQSTIKNIHLIESNFYLYPIETTIPTFEYFDQKFKSIKFQGFNSWEQQFYQYYRLYDTYNLLLNYRNKTGINYDYVIKLRPDILLLDDCVKIFDIFETRSKLNIFMEHNIFWVSTFNFSNIIPLLVENYGKYHLIYRDLTLYSFYKPFDPDPYIYSSEVQVTNCIFNYCIYHGLNIRDAFLGSVYGTYIKLLENRK